jgi:osmotically inducible protein OsmC
MVASALDLDLAELLAGEDEHPPGSAPHTGRAVWNGTEKSGSGVMIKGDVRIRYDLAYRSNPLDSAANPDSAANGDDADLGSPEALLGMAFAGCFSMALAADLDDAGFEPFRIETFAKARTETGANGIALRDIELHCEAAVADIPQARFQTIAEQTKRNCLVSRALAAVPARLDARLVTVGE